MLFFNKVVVVAVFVSIQSIHPEKKQTVEKPKDTIQIEGFTLVVASWVIRARCMMGNSKIYIMTRIA